MYLQKLSVLNFKNHSDSSIELHPTINCFVGENGSGKTNLLDAVYYLSFTKSFFTKRDQLNITYDQPFMSIDGVFDHGDKSDHIQCAVKLGAKKVIRRNKKVYDKLSDHIGLYPLVMVSPTDNELLLSGSDVRRKYMDSVISQFDKVYLNNLIAYNRLIAHRNALLKNQQNLSSGLQLYDDQIAPLCDYIHEKRRLFLDELRPIFLNYYSRISAKKEDVSIEYSSQLLDKSYLTQCIESRQKDLALQFSTVGIHKDDLVFSLQKQLVKRAGSQGQQKTFLLALKLAQFDFMKKALGYKPLLLLDDIFDKLDQARVQHLMELIHNHHFGQLFVTDTNEQRTKTIFDNIKADFKIFHIKNGNVEKED